MDGWGRDVCFSDRGCFFRVCPSLGSDILLGSNSNYKYDHSGSLCGSGLVLMVMGGVHCRGPDFKTVFCPAFFASLCDRTIFCHPSGAPS